MRAPALEDSSSPNRRVWKRRRFDERAVEGAILPAAGCWATATAAAAGWLIGGASLPAARSDGTSCSTVGRASGTLWTGNWLCPGNRL